MNFRIPCGFGLLIAILCVGCTGSTPTAGRSSEPAPSPASTPEVNACEFLSPADAEQVMGAPMKKSATQTQPVVCMYEEVTARPNSLGPARFSLTVNKRKSKDDEDKDWANLKEVRHLQAGQKNTQALSGIGDEAWFTGNTEKGKVGVAAVIVRKGSSNFMLDSMVLEYRASPEAMKSLAKRIAGQLQ